VAGAQHHTGPLRGEEPGCCLTQSAVCAGNDDNLSGNVVYSSLSLPVLPLSQAEDLACVKKCAPQGPITPTQAWDVAVSRCLEGDGRPLHFCLHMERGMCSVWG
jgi:hypothetical protein